VLLFAGCSNDVGKVPPVLGGARGHAIHVFEVHPDGTKKQLDFGPGTELGTRRDGATGGRLTGQSATTMVPGLHGLGGGLQPPPTIGNTGNSGEGTFDPRILSTAWALVSRAALLCGADGSVLPDLVAQDSPWTAYSNSISWYIFLNHNDSSCAAHLFEQQTLLCVADKLAEIGDAVSTIVWPAGNCSINPAAFTYGSDAAPQPLNCTEPEWDIPPQADADRFIVRDLAIHTLGMVAALDALPVADFTGCPADPNRSGHTLCTCSAMFGDVANGDPLNPIDKKNAFGVYNASPVFG
jgi:hypothetical protein